jgi:hypothetical protein
MEGCFYLLSDYEPLWRSIVNSVDLPCSLFPHVSFVPDTKRERQSLQPLWFLESDLLERTIKKRFGRSIISDFWRWFIVLLP